MSVLFLFSSCSSPPYDGWVYEISSPPCPEYRSGRTHLPCTNPFSSFDVELARGQAGYRLYLNLLAGQFQNPLVRVDGIVFEGSIFEGEQRMLLPPDAMNPIISRLQEGHDVCIQIGRQETTLTPHGFDEALCALQSISYEGIDVPTSLYP